MVVDPVGRSLGLGVEGTVVGGQDADGGGWSTAVDGCGNDDGGGDS